MIAEISQFFVDGGFWMIPIAGVSVVAVAVAVERIYALFFVYNTDGNALYNKVLAAVKNNQDSEAIQICERLPKAVIARVLKGGLVNADKGEDVVSSGIEEATLEVTPLLLKRTGSLGGLASLATLLGLLGTVMGLIDAFKTVAEAPADQKSALLTSAIAVAMNTTAFGLIAAIPVTIVFMLLSGTTKKIMDEIDLFSLKLENTLRARKK